MIRIVKLTNRIGFAINIFGFKFPLILGHREMYWDPPQQIGVTSHLKYRNHWFKSVPKGSFLELSSCSLSTICETMKREPR